MVRKWGRPGPVLVACIIVLAAAIGCTGPGSEGRFPIIRSHWGRSDRTEEELRAAIGWIDPPAQDAGRGTISADELLAFAAQNREARKPAVLFPRKSILILSGGGSYGAYPAGVLVGWTATGTRPEFDVVTGISTGALIAPLAFLGASEDHELRRHSTTTRTPDIYRKRRPLAALLSQSLADNTPLAKMIDELATCERLRRVAEEHRKGRRLYVGTTDLDTRRAAVWDMGEIASRGTPESRELFCKVLLASAAIPGFFPPVKIPITVDGRRYVERHIDGGASSAMIYAPPYVPPGEKENLPPGWLTGSDLYILVAGKIYPDPAPVKPRTIATASAAVSAIVYDQTRGDLHKLFLVSAVTGLNYNLSAVPRELQSKLTSTDFIPEELTRLFEAGREWAAAGPNWRKVPPGYWPGEGSKYRAGTVLTDVGQPMPEGVLGPTPWPIPNSPMAPVVPEK